MNNFFIISLKWVLPKATIALNKFEAKENYNQIAHNLDPQNNLVIYTDGNRIKSEMRITAVISAQRIICKALFYSSKCFTIYLSEPQSIVMALNIILSTNSKINKAKIFTNNQSATYSAENLLRQLGQQILRFIVNSINRLCKKRIDLELYWV